MKKIFLIAITLLGFTITINAQETGEQRNGEEETGAWLMYFGTNRIADKWSIHTEAQFRYYETISNYNQLLLRTGANYHINDNAIATLGYGFIDTDPSFEDFTLIGGDIMVEDIDITEHRIFEQLILKNKVGEFLFEHRYRLEQRFININGVNDTQHRARYRLQVTLPLTQTFFLNFYDEVFINLQDQPFGQNRLYAAAGLHITENSSLQLGYLKNHFNTTNFDRLQIGFFYNPDLRKKK